MDDLDVLARDFGIRPQGKSNPMRSDGGDRRSASVRTSPSPLYDDHSNNRDGLLYKDIFGGPPEYENNSNNNNKYSSVDEFDYDSIFRSAPATNDSRSKNNDNSKTSSVPVYDEPVYDDHIFDGLPGIKSKSVSSGRFEEDVFTSEASSPPKGQGNRTSNTNDQLDDLLEKFGRTERNSIKSSRMDAFDDLLVNLGRHDKMEDGQRSNKSSDSRGFDDLLKGFETGSHASGHRSASELGHGPSPTSTFGQSASNTTGDPFIVLESTSSPGPSSQRVFTDPLEEFVKLGKSGSTKNDAPSVSGGVFYDLDPLGSFRKYAEPLSPPKNSRAKDASPSRSGPSITSSQASASREQAGIPSGYSYSHLQRKVPDDGFQDSPIFDMPTAESLKSFHQNASSSSGVNASVNEKNSRSDMPPRYEEHDQPSDDIWITVSEIPLFTQPTRAPRPSRPPPPIPRHFSNSEGTFFSTNIMKKGEEFTSPTSCSSHSQSPHTVCSAGNGTPVSEIDESEDFVFDKAQNSVDETNGSSVAAASAAAMKEAMDRAEAKFRHAKEVREREFAKTARTKEALHAEKDYQDAEEREFRENQERLEREQCQREEEVREQKRIERERERAREFEREKARQAVERATREARERAAADARERAATEARLKAERAAVEKVHTEARERAERAAVQRAQAEARKRAAAEARERAEKSAADALDRANAEARDKELREKAAVERAATEARRRAERAAVERATAEARERAAVEARERAAAAARANQQRADNDLESFFSTSSRASSAPRPRAQSDNIFDAQSKSSTGPQAAKTSSVASASNMRKASSTTNISDDLSSLFGGASSAGEFQEVEGETEERRRARLERHQRTLERAAKALAEKNQRDLQAQREQEERHRMAESLDFEIKRWAAGKEGNLRALLSTLQYVLWPECVWQPASLTDLITGASVKKVYMKAALCIHPDKVQQKGATPEQKYIAEMVFYLIKEAWNKFNSEELF